jgi:hypothetical protein
MIPRKVVTILVPAPHRRRLCRVSLLHETKAVNPMIRPRDFIVDGTPRASTAPAFRVEERGVSTLTRR